MIRSLLLAALAAAALPAQDCVAIGPEPGAGGNGGWLPYTSSGSSTPHWRRQILIPAIWFGNVPTLIRDIAVANDRGWLSMEYELLEVHIGHTTVSSLDYIFANNVTGPMQQVLRVEQHAVTFGPGPQWHALGLQQPFQFVPGQGNLLIDFTVVGATRLGGTPLQAWGWTASTTGYDYDVAVSQFSSAPPTQSSGGYLAALRLCTDRAWTNVFGSACGGAQAPLLAISGSPEPGGSATFWVSNVGPGLPAVLAFGSDNAPPYPLDLGVLGAPGCRQYFAVDLTVGVVTNASGFGSHTVQIPNNAALVGATVFGQYVALAPGANALDLLTSDYGRIHVGS